MKYIFGLWEAARVPGENPGTHREDMQIPHRKVPPGILTRGFSLPSCNIQLYKTFLLCEETKIY